MNRRGMIMVSLALVLSLSAIAMAISSALTDQASERYRTARHQLEAAVQDAQAAGYTQDDLAPVFEAKQQAMAASEPVLIWDRPSYYDQLAARLAQVRLQVGEVEAMSLDKVRTAAADSLHTANDKLAAGKAANLDPIDLAPLQQKIDEISKAEGGARLPSDFRKVMADSQTVVKQMSDLEAAAAAERAAVELSAKDLAQKDIESIHKAGNNAVFSGRNDATVAAFLKLEGKPVDVDKPYRALERYASLIGSGDVQQAAMGAAGAIRYAGMVHDAMTKSTNKIITISTFAQELWAYDTGKVALDTVVTTGRPALPTDVGPMKVLWKASPWTMHSPWPKGSPFYYPDSKVRKVIWFTTSGEGLHDAPWRGWFGPGSDRGDGTHGCVNLPGSTVDSIFDWADVGTPVIVIPGDGSPQADQVKHDTIDDPATSGQPKGA